METRTSTRSLHRAQHQLLAQLALAHSRLRPRTYQNVTVVHLLWDTPEDILRYDPRSKALCSGRGGHLHAG